MSIQRRARQQRRASVTNTQRTARLELLRQSQRTRLANETEEQRAARLQQLRQSQEARIPNETEEQRADRLQHDAQQHRIVNSGVPLLDQPAIQKKIKKFHIELASLEVPQPCTTCQQAIPKISPILSLSQECKRCFKDTCYPKVYSCDNNMDPGPIPSELQVCSELFSIINLPTINY